MTYYLTYKDSKSDKFWQIDIDGSSHTVTYGKTGSKGTCKTKTFGSDQDCLEDAQKLKNQKLKKGYVEQEPVSSDNSEQMEAEATPQKPSVESHNAPTSVDKPIKVESENVDSDWDNQISLNTPEELIDAIEAYISVNELMAASDYCYKLHSLKLTPNQTEKAFFLSGQIALKLHDYVKAELDLMKGGKQASLLLAEMYRSHQQLDHAYYYYDQDGSFEALWSAGLLGKTHDFNVAKKYFEAALQIAQQDNRPELWDCYLKLGSIYHAADKETAKQYYLKSLNTGKAQPALYSNLAILYIELDENEKALEILNTATERFPEDALAYFNKSCLFARQNEPDQAMEQLEKAFLYGYQNFRQIAADSDFESLRERGDFKALIDNYNNYSVGTDEQEFLDHPERYTKVSVASYTRFKEFPESLFKAYNMESFRFEDHSLKKLPVDLFNMKKLKRWSFMDTSIKEVPEEALDKPFESVDLELKRINEFPAYLKRLQGLKILYLSSVRFTEIPKEIAHLKQLEYLLIKHSKITSIHREIGSLSNLHDLEIRDTAITALPSEIARLKKLKTLAIIDNPELKYFPEEIILMPNLVRIRFHKNGFPSTEANKLIEDGFENKVERKLLALHMAVLQDNKAYLEDNATIADMLVALNSPVALLREKVLMWLSEQDAAKPLSEESEVLVLGKFDKTITEVKNELAELGAKVAKKYSGSTTHVLIGQKPGDKLSPLIAKDVVWVTEKHLTAGNGAASTAEESVELSPQRINQIKMLLTSTEPANLEMALDIIEVTVSAKLFGMELFLANQYTTDAKLKKRILALVKSCDNEPLQTAILKKYGFRTAAEKKVNEYVKTLAPEIGADLNEFAFAIHKLSGGRSGIEYLLENGTYEYCVKVLDNSIQDDTIEYNYDYNFSSFPDAIKEFQGLKKLRLINSKFKKFPLSVLNLPHLEVLDISGSSMRSIPLEIEKMKGLIELDLSNNNISKLPDQVCGLEQLKKLNLSFNSSLTKLPVSINNMTNLEELILTQTKITALPDEISELKKLKTIDICDNKSNEFRVFPEVLAELESLEKLFISLEQAQSFVDKIGGVKSLKKLEVYYEYGKKKDYEALQDKLPDLEVSSTYGW